MRMLLAVSCAVLAITAAAAAQNRPAALLKAERARAALRTGVVEYIYRRADEDRPVVYSARFGERGDSLVNRGDESGRFYYADGSVNELCAEHVVLKLPDQTWWHNGDGMGATLQESGARQENIWRMRSLGMGFSNSYHDLHDTLWWDHSGGPEARTYEETIEDGLHVVRAHTSYGTIVWWIDSRRGWNPVRVALERNGRVKQESRSILKQTDGVWFPAKVKFYWGDGDEGHAPHEVVESRSAEFNRPNHPRVLTPEHIGIDAGVMVTVRRDNDDSTPDEIMVWDGQKPITQQEAAKLAQAGKFKRGPNNLRALARLEAEAIIRQLSPDGLVGGSDASEPSARQRRESRWEAYTRAFVHKYRLDDAQTQRAYAILRDCQERANRYLLRHRAAIEKVQAEARSVMTLEDPDKRTAAVTELRLRHSKLIRPVHAIFDKQLKPRLDKLPTRAQRKATGESTARAGRSGE